MNYNTAHFYHYAYSEKQQMKAWVAEYGGRILREPIEHVASGIVLYAPADDEDSIIFKLKFGI